MIKNISAWALAPAAACLTLSAAPLSADEVESAVALPASEFAPQQRFAITYDEPKDVAEFYVRTLGLSPRDADYEEGRNPRNPRHKVVIATVQNINDPTVTAIQWRIELKAQSGAWEAVEAGLRRKCRKGSNSDAWTRETCPSQ